LFRGKNSRMAAIARIRAPLGGLLALVLCAVPASAQFFPFTGPASPPPVVAPPPAPQQPTRPAAAPTPQQNAARFTLGLNARYAPDGPYVIRALHWRIFAERTGSVPLELVGESTDSAPAFVLASGRYVVHVAYGFASFAQRVNLTANSRQTMIVAAGGLRLQGRIGETQIPPQKLRFDVYEGNFLQRGPNTGGLKKRTARNERPPVVRGAAAGDLVLLPAGTYHVQSTFGEGNSTITADVRIEAGRLTDATVHHRAAQITLRLVSNSGGEALANTSWSVLTPGGDSIKEFIGAFPSIVLADGEYVAVARHDGRTYQHIFKVVSGRDREVEVLAVPENQQAVRP
jgi:hypothetical protein